MKPSWKAIWQYFDLQILFWTPEAWTGSALFQCTTLQKHVQPLTLSKIATKDFQAKLLMLDWRLNQSLTTLPRKAHNIKTHLAISTRFKMCFHANFTVGRHFWINGHSANKLLFQILWISDFTYRSSLLPQHIWLMRGVCISLLATWTFGLE